MIPVPDHGDDDDQETIDYSAPKRRQKYINGGRGRWKHCRQSR